jgi:hypothetical protein
LLTGVTNVSTLLMMLSLTQTRSSILLKTKDKLLLSLTTSSDAITRKLVSLLSLCSLSKQLATNFSFQLSFVCLTEFLIACAKVLE